MTSALEDVTVVELTTESWSALGAALLGDFGARVVRVDDLSRPAPDADRDGLHPREAFDADAELVDRNKVAVGLDLTETRGAELLGELVAAADVFWTDLPHAELAARGLDPETLVAGHPGLVVVRGSGFGPRGPDRDLPALDELAAARTGVMPILPQPGEPPVYAGAGQMYTAVMLAFGAVVAVHERAASGQGQVVDASLFAGNLYGASLQLDAYLAMRDERLCQPISRLESANPMSGAGLAYPTSDGRWITLTMPDTDRWWPALSALMGIDTDDPRFDTHDKRCGEGRLELMALLEAGFAAQPGAHWRQRFDEGQFSADVIEKYDFVANYPQAALNRYVLSLEHASYGTYQSLGFPIHLSDTPARMTRMAPGVGQHSAEILAGLLGRSDDEISELEAAGVIGTRHAPELTPAGAAPATVPASPAVATATEADPAPVGADRRPLEGIRVLDCTVWFQGPVCSQHLADFGAEVIHIERPGYGDPARGVRSINAVPVADWNQYFLVTNRNKRSMAVDLKADAGRELMYRLVAQADVFLWNQSMANLEPLGLDHATLSGINPRLVYATNSGYGHRGTNKPAFDMTVQALTGIMTRLGEPGQPPIYLGLGSGDAFGGLMSALGIMVALHRRRLTGTGQHIDASLLGSQLFLAAPTLQRYLATHDSAYADQRSRTEAPNPLWNRFPASDRWLVLCAPDTDDAWQALCAAAGWSDLAADARYATAEGRHTHRRPLIEALDAAFAAGEAEQWVAALRSAGLAVAAVNDFSHVAGDEQAWANDYFVRLFCGEAGGEVEFRGLPVTLSRTPGKVERLGPELGQDTELGLVETFGCSWDEIGELKAAGAIP